MFKRVIFSTLVFMAGLFFSPLQAAEMHESAIVEGSAREGYIERWHDEAIRQMVLHRIPASITLAQGLLESGSGDSELARKSNNHFGIKCHAGWEGARTYHDDDEKGECFRVYANPGASYQDHSLFLKRKRYEKLFELKITDYKGWARGLKKCGYATNPAYAKLLIELIEDHDLEAYDKEGVRWIKKGKVPDSPADDSDEGLEDSVVNNDEKSEEKAAIAESVAAAGLVLGTRDWGLSDNNVVWVRAGTGDTFKKLAAELDMMAWQLRKYNDLQSKAKLKTGDRIYVQPKRRRGARHWHVATAGETLRKVSAMHGVKLDVLVKRHGESADRPLRVGEKVALRFTPDKNGRVPWFARIFDSPD